MLRCTRFWTLSTEWLGMSAASRRSSSTSEAMKAFRRLVLLFHPDKCALPRTREAFEAVMEAKAWAEGWKRLEGRQRYESEESARERQRQKMQHDREMAERRERHREKMQQYREAFQRTDQRLTEMIERARRRKTTGMCTPI